MRKGTLKTMVVFATAGLIFPALPVVGEEKAAAAELRIERLEPTPLFPKHVEGQPLQQLALLYLDNPGVAFMAVARIAM